MVAQRLGDRVGIVHIIPVPIGYLRILINHFRVRVIKRLREILLRLVEVVLPVESVNFPERGTRLLTAQFLHGGHELAHGRLYLIREGKVHQVPEIGSLTVPYGLSVIIPVTHFNPVPFLRLSLVGRVKDGVKVIITPTPAVTVRELPEYVRVRILGTVVRTGIELHPVGMQNGVVNVNVVTDTRTETVYACLDEQFIQLIHGFAFNVGGRKAVALIHQLRVKVDGTLTRIGRHEPPFRLFVIAYVTVCQPELIRLRAVSVEPGVQFLKRAGKRFQPGGTFIDEIIMGDKLAYQFRLPGIQVPGIDPVILERLLIPVVSDVRFSRVPWHTVQCKQRGIVRALDGQEIRVGIRVVTESVLVTFVRADCVQAFEGIHRLPLFINAFLKAYERILVDRYAGVRLVGQTHFLRKVINGIDGAHLVGLHGGSEVLLGGHALDFRKAGHKVPRLHV